MNNNAKLNTFLIAIIAVLCVVIAGFSYLVFGDASSKEMPNVSSMATAVAPAAPKAQEKSETKKQKPKDNRGGPVYVWGQDDRSATSGQVSNVQVIRGTNVNNGNNGIGDETYVVCNKRSGIFHYPNCAGVAIMNHNNAERMTAGEAKIKGYRMHIGCPD